MTTEVKTWSILRSGLARRVVFLVAVFSAVWAAPANSFNFDTGNAAGEVVVEAIIPVVLQRFSPADATLLLRHTTLVNNAWFDAIAPYHPTAVGVYSRLGRRPPEESMTNRNLNIAVLYASYRVLNNLQPGANQAWRDMLSDVGLDPDNDSTDTTTPEGIGNVAGNAIAAARENDGMNQLGNEVERKCRKYDDDDDEEYGYSQERGRKCKDQEERKYNRMPYADYLGYVPVNTAYRIRYPGRWQPNFATNGGGIFRIQQFVTPQMRVVEPYTDINPRDFRAPKPKDSNPNRRRAYRKQTDEVLAESAVLTDERKMIVELFDDKLLSLGASSFAAAVNNNLPLAETIHYQFLVNFAAFDGAIVTWQEKYRYDAVRPFTAVRYLYGNKLLTAWGGPGQGTVDDITGNEWRSYVPTADHPDYPSASACFCAAHSQASRRYFNSDALSFDVPAPAGSSRIEPGITPAQDLVLKFDSWTDFEERCALSRYWGGMHFLPAVVEGRKLCRSIGDSAFEFLQDHINGTAPERGPAKRTDM